MITATAFAFHTTQKLEVPRPLALEVFELRHEFSDFLKNKKYKKFLKGYEDWTAEELVSRLRILCTEARANAYEIIAIGERLGC